MSMNGYIRAAFAFMTAVAMVYILEITYGAAMDVLYLTFKNLTPTLPMAAGWMYQADHTLDGWKWFYRAFLIVLIAIAVWMVSTIIQMVDYARQMR